MALVPFEFSTQFTTQQLNQKKNQRSLKTVMKPIAWSWALWKWQPRSTAWDTNSKTLHLATHTNRIWIISNHEVQLLSLKAAEKKLNHVYYVFACICHATFRGQLSIVLSLSPTGGITVAMAILVISDLFSLGFKRQAVPSVLGRVGQRNSIGKSIISIGKIIGVAA